ncbi:MAG: cytochrome C [Bacteroidetes bacterium]|nr:cytochrome C [Bacteroidota bacterium]
MKKTIILSSIGAAIFAFAACGDSNTPSQSNSQTTTETTTASATTQIPADIQELLQKNTCLTCHTVDTRLVGPAYKEVAQKNYTPEQIVELVHKPMPEHWAGYPPMAPLPNVPAEDIIKIANWINSLK